MHEDSLDQVVVFVGPHVLARKPSSSEEKSWDNACVRFVSGAESITLPRAQPGAKPRHIKEQRLSVIRDGRKVCGCPQQAFKSQSIGISRSFKEYRCQTASLSVRKEDGAAHHHS